MKPIISALLMSLILIGCAHYQIQDDVQYHGMSYGSIEGSDSKIYYRNFDHKTTTTDKHIQINIGEKTFSEFGNNKDLASEIVSSAIVEKEEFCSNGYEISYNPNDLTSDHDFMWLIECK